MATLLRDLRARGVNSKSWTIQNGKHRPGKLIDKGYIYRLFKSPLYIGIAAYKGNHYPGEHEPHIDCSLWDQVQRLIQTGGARAKRHYAPPNNDRPIDPARPTRLNRGTSVYASVDQTRYQGLPLLRQHRRLKT